MMRIVSSRIFDLLSQAGDIALKYYLKGGYSIVNKSTVDIVTQADRDIDLFFHKRLAKLYPEMDILTEETAPENYSSLKDKEFVWIIDPLDGTINFSRNYLSFCISIGLVNFGKPIFGAVYAPLTKDMFWASDDKQRSYRNRELLKVSTVSRLTEVILGTDWSHKLPERKKTVKYLDVLSQKVRRINITGNILNILSVAEGTTDGYFHGSLKPWDKAAAVIIITKAGGKVTGLNGEEQSIFSPGILATNNIIHSKLLKLMK